MKLGYGMTKQDWKELLDKLRNVKGVYLSSYPVTDKDGLFVDFKYATFEYNNQFFYIQEEFFEKLSITAYQKVNPFEKHQIEYPVQISTFDELVDYINKPRAIRPFKDTFNQRIYRLELYGMENGKTTLCKLSDEIAGNREKDILMNLEHIEMMQHDKDYEVLRFWHKNGEEFFDYECNSKRITG